ncbi:MAG: YigZ family protein [Thermodesulfobacteriota bacterium]
MSKETSYLVPSEKVRVEQEIKKSRFITTISRAADREKAKSFIEKISAEYPDASHNCYAFVAGNPNSSPDIGMGDDGEVQGTAGKPMLSVLQHKRIGEIVVVVTRYFGGIKLGSGGLVRAYTSSLQLALDKINLERRVAVMPATIVIDYQYENSVRQILKKNNIDIYDIGYKNDLIFHIEVPENLEGKVQEEIMSSTRGQAQINWHNE